MSITKGKLAMDCSVGEKCVFHLHLLQEEETEESNKEQVVLLFFFFNLAPSYCLLVLNAVLKICCLLSPSWEAETWRVSF